MKNYLTLEQASELIQCGMSEKYSSMHFTTLNEKQEPSYFSAEMNTPDTGKYKYPTFTVADLERFLIEKGYDIRKDYNPQENEVRVMCQGRAGVYYMLSSNAIDALFYCVKRQFDIKNKKNDIPRK